MAFGNIAFDLIQEGKSGRMACLAKANTTISPWMS
jgi:hypothetical protein